ncbi:preprotein translocase subunit SecY [Candidatus Pacearchaeota archaeon]|nr:preprotein translocase subunit SecY [Candidatus Pacearchaeota archaeon]|tara:strand:+ start:33615 stop:35000 length:1386 start_codon:yes stop_codon:yes gene_type:complete
MGLKDLLHNLPEVTAPTEKKVSFKTGIKWTLIILVAYFILSNITMYGISESALSRFEYLAILLGTTFGSIVSLGIGPIVMASIILQLLVGSQILNIDTSTTEGKKFFQGIQKLLAMAFVVFESFVYVLMGGIPASSPGLVPIVIVQLCLGGFIILFMDEVITKWGFGSGISLFIAAGIGWRLFTQLFQFMGSTGFCNILTGEDCIGNVWAFVASLAMADGRGSMLALVPVLVTVALFFLVVFAQSLKVEIPLSYDRVRGYGIRWPLQFFYAGVIPVILVSALVANIQLLGSLLESWLGHETFLGTFSNGAPVAGLAYWVHFSNIAESIINNNLIWKQVAQAILHILFYMFLSVIFAYFWVMTSGQDAKSQADRIMKSGMSIPGFRKDPRVLESILKRYVGPLTIMGGAAVGLLASVADLFGALVGGTAILLAIMILYQLYQNIAQQYAMDMNPAMRNFFGG